MIIPFTQREVERLHRFEVDLSDVEFPDRFTWPFCYTPHALTKLAFAQLVKDVSDDLDLWQDFAPGKMLGALVVRDAQGKPGFLATYSGNLPSGREHPYFVPAIVDLLAPGGEYRKGEAAITELNKRLEDMEHSPEYRRLKSHLTTLQQQQMGEMMRLTTDGHLAKVARDKKRREPGVTPAELEELNRQSAHRKAEMKRWRAKQRNEIEPLERAVERYEAEMAEMRKLRSTMSDALQRRLFELYVVSNARGERRRVLDVWREHFNRMDVMPPAGTGECCAPKLLQYAYDNGLKPVCMAEMWTCAPPFEGKTENRNNGDFCQACEHKCRPLLTFMLQGLDVEPDPLRVMQAAAIRVVYKDRAVLVVNKPAGMLSVPGRDRPGDSVLERMLLQPEFKKLLPVHRLDMATSGLLVFARSEPVQKALQRQFEQGEVDKTYVAVLEGTVTEDEGVIDLPLRPDYELRPRQVVDDGPDGKRAVTHYRVLSRTEGRTRVIFSPLTGRTHQLRVHAAHRRGLGAPIVGDALYGQAGDRLLLHAASITFTHPTTRERMTLKASPTF